MPFYRQVEVKRSSANVSSREGGKRFQIGDKLAVVGCPYDKDKGATQMRVVVLSRTRGDVIKCLADLGTSVNGEVVVGAPKVRRSEDGTYTFPEKSLTSSVQGVVASVSGPCEPQPRDDEWATDSPPVRTPEGVRGSQPQFIAEAEEAARATEVVADDPEATRWFSRTIGKVKMFFNVG